MSQQPPQDDKDDEVLPVEAAADPEPDHSQLRRCRRFVSVTPRVQFGKGVKLFAYGYADLASLMAMSEAAVRQAVRRKTFDPGDLRSIFEFLLSRLGDRRVRERLLGPVMPLVIEPPPKDDET